MDPEIHPLPNFFHNFFKLNVLGRGTSDNLLPLSPVNAGCFNLLMRYGFLISEYKLSHVLLTNIAGWYIFLLGIVIQRPQVYLSKQG